jgi:2-amino-4-hydroxy-6-hydroxymethyldihydropteridine diphosphokinase
MRPNDRAPVLALIGLGGNEGAPAALVARLRAAADAVAALPAVRALRRSPVYRTAPVGPVAEQPPFLNAALAAEVDPGAACGADPTAPAQRLLADLLAIERRLGRDRTAGVRGGPRPIDLDLLTYGDLVADVPGLTLPHPRLAERGFVLRPLADLLGPDWPAPGRGRTLAECLAAVADQAVAPTELTL